MTTTIEARAAALTDRQAMLIALAILADGAPSFYKRYIGFPVRMINDAVRMHWIGDQCALRIGRVGVHPRNCRSFTISQHALWLQRRGRVAYVKLGLKPANVRLLGARCHEGSQNRENLRQMAEPFKAAKAA